MRQIADPTPTVDVDGDMNDADERVENTIVIVEGERPSFTFHPSIGNYLSMFIYSIQT